MICTIIPPYILRRLAEAGDPNLAAAAASAERSLTLDRPLRAARASVAGGGVRTSLAAQQPVEPLDPQRTISDAHHTENLPGDVVRTDGAPAGDDPAVTESYDGLGDTHELYRSVYGRASIDNNNLPLDATVHYGTDYDNAFWDGERMVFGDGDEQIFTRMTKSLTVIGHELTHGVTQFSANLTYQGQSGALNESVSDVFGSLVEQFTLGQSVDAASWLIGAEILTDKVQGVALRSMKSPGTAYDDDVLGKDPQPDSMDGFVETDDDNGGVHINSGIPNRAFYEVAAALGGNAWERAGQVWYDTLVSGTLGTEADFAEFAAATVAAAASRFGADSEEHAAVVAGWTTVGVDVQASVSS